MVNTDTTTPPPLDVTLRQGRPSHWVVLLDGNVTALSIRPSERPGCGLMLTDRGGYVDGFTTPEAARLYAVCVFGWQSYTAAIARVVNDARGC